MPVAPLAPPAGCKPLFTPPAAVRPSNRSKRSKPQGSLHLQDAQSTSRRHTLLVAPLALCEDLHLLPRPASRAGQLNDGPTAFGEWHLPEGFTSNCQPSWDTWRGLSGSNARRMTPRPGETVAHRRTTSESVQLRAPDRASAPIARSPPPQAGLGAAQCGPSDRAPAGLHWRRRTCTAVEGGALRQRGGSVRRRWARGCGNFAGGGMARKQQGGRQAMPNHCLPHVAAPHVTAQTIIYARSALLRCHSQTTRAGTSPTSRLCPLHSRAPMAAASAQ